MMFMRRAKGSVVSALEAWSRSNRTRESSHFEPRSGAIYVAQCVSVGVVGRVLNSRGAAASTKENSAPRDAQRKGRVVESRLVDVAAPRLPAMRFDIPTLTHWAT